MRHRPGPSVCFLWQIKALCSAGLQVQNIDEVRTDYYKGVAMPFEMNNVDVTVAANSVYGITSAVLSGLLPASILDDPVVGVS